MTKKNFIEIAHTGDCVGVIDNNDAKWYFSFFNIVGTTVFGSFIYNVESKKFHSTFCIIEELFDLKEIKEVEVLDNKTRDMYITEIFKTNN